MQIFATFHSPVKSALALDDRRARKAIIEAAQILSTVLYSRAPLHVRSRLYKPVALRPVITWPGERRANYLWLVQHYEALGVRYLHSSGRQHATIDRLPPSFFKELAALVPAGGFTDPPNATENQRYAVSFKHVKDVYRAYRLYLQARWRIEMETHIYKPAIHVSVGRLHEFYDV